MNRSTAIREKVCLESISEGVRRTNGQTQSCIVAAMKAVQSKELSIRAAGAKFGIPSSTLHDHLRGTSTKRYGGAPTILTANEEKEIVTSCLVMQESGFPLTREFVSMALRDYIEGPTNSRKALQGMIGGQDS